MFGARSRRQAALPGFDLGPTDQPPFDPPRRTDTAVALATLMCGEREFSGMPILADALMDAGCSNDEVLSHCRGPNDHARGCWVVDLVLGRA